MTLCNERNNALFRFIASIVKPLRNSRVSTSAQRRRAKGTTNYL